MYKITFYAGSKIMEVWKIEDKVLTSRRMKSIMLNLQWLHQNLCYTDECEYIAAAIDHDGKPVVSICEFLRGCLIHRSVWHIGHESEPGYRRIYGLGGVR